MEVLEGVTPEYFYVKNCCRFWEDDLQIFSNEYLSLGAFRKFVKGSPEVEILARPHEIASCWQFRIAEPKVSSENKLPFMILNPQRQLHKNGLSCKNPASSYRKMNFLQKNAFSYRKCTFLQKTLPFPTEKCPFLQKNAALGGHIARNCRKSQESFRAQESRTLVNFHKTIGGAEMTRMLSDNNSRILTAP